MSEKQTVSYYAISLFSSRTVWVAVGTVVVGILALPDVVAIIPLRYLPIVTAIIGAVNFVLRLVTVRPVVFAAPGTITPVAVPRLDPPVPMVTD